MCGITAIFRPEGKLECEANTPNDVEVLMTMTSLIGHRGPDDAGYITSQHLESGAGRVLLGHVRLSVRDIAAGPQPMIWEDPASEDKVAITYNGEIYDIQDIKGQLEEYGFIFHTATDTEVVLLAFVHYGTACFAMFNGEFSFVIADFRTNDLYAVRDRYGIKPLFTAHWMGATYFASEAKAILGIPSFPRKLSSRFLNQTIWGCYDEGHSSFEGIDSLVPGTYLHIDAEGHHTYSKYYESAWKIDSAMTFESAARGIEARLTKAVQRRLQSDAPVCAYLSGGIDSAVVASLARKSQGYLKAFNLSFGGDSEFDEKIDAIAIAKHLDIDLEIVDCGAESLASDLEAALYHTETSTPNPSVVGKYILSRAANRAGYKVTLTGEGSDEILAGYPFFKLEQLWRMIQVGTDSERHQAERLIRDFKALESRSEGLLWNDTKRWRTLPKLPGFTSANYLRAVTYDVYRRLALKPSVMSRAEHSPTSVYDAYDLPGLRKLHPLHASMLINLHHLSNWIFPSLGDRPEMANHVEGRTPFLDNDLSEFAATIPPEHLIHIGSLREKAPLYAAFSHHLPPKVTRDHKHPFLAPGWRDVLLTEPGRVLMQDHLSFSAIRSTGIFNPLIIWLLAMVWWLLPSTSRLYRKLDAFIGVVLSVQILHYRFIVNRPEAPAREISPVAIPAVRGKNF